MRRPIHDPTVRATELYKDVDSVQSGLRCCTVVHVSFLNKGRNHFQYFTKIGREHSLISFAV